KSYSLPHASVEAHVDPDGSVRGQESITFDFSGSFCWADRGLPFRPNLSFDQVKVSENGDEYTPGGNTELGGFGLPGTFGVTGANKSLRIVWHYSATDEQRTFQISYRMRGLAIAYDDVVDVNFRVWGDEWQASP